MELSLTLSAVILAVSLYSYINAWNFLRTIYLSTKIPGPSLWEMVTVHAKGLLGNNLAEYTWKMCANYENKPWGMWTLMGYIVMVSDCESLREVYKNKHLTNRAALLVEHLVEYIGEGLMSLNGEEHRMHRKLLGPAFRKNLLESHLSGINEEAAKLVQRIREKGEDCVDVRCLVEDQVAAIFIFAHFSGDVPCEKYKGFFRVMSDIAFDVHLHTVNPWYYWLVHNMKKSTRLMKASVKMTLEDARKRISFDAQTIMTKRSKNYQKPISIMDVLVDASAVFGEDGLIDETLTIASAGQDTTAFVENITLVLLALHPDVQDKVFEEIQSIGLGDRPVLAEDLARMDYLEMVLKETLRLFPAVPVVARRADEEKRIGGLLIPKGSAVMTQLMAINRDPKFFKDPLKFDPERFSRESSQGRHAFAYVPFGGGIRVCPGQVMAFMVLKTILSHVVRNFQILPGDGFRNVDDIPVSMYFTLRLTKSSLRFLSRGGPGEISN